MIGNFHPISGLQLVYLLLAGLAAAGGQFAITAAYTYAPGKEISIYDYTQIIFSTLLGLFLFGQMPDGFSILGYVIIITAAVVKFFYKNRRNKTE